MTDIIYPLKSDTAHDCNELKYSLRSVDMYLQNVGRIYIISDSLPDWIQNVELIRVKDYPGLRVKEFNIATKVCAACNNENVSDPFLFMNDDHFLLRGYYGGMFPYYYSSSLDEKVKLRRPGDPYRTSCENTLKYLQANNKPTKYFDIHSPILYCKDVFKQIIERANWKDYGFVIKSLYCNLLGIEGECMSDLKLGPPLDLSSIEGRSWFSSCNRILVPEFWEWMENRYPAKSRWEK